MLTPPEFKLSPQQLLARGMLASDARHCALGGGARSGKTFLLVRQVIVRALRANESRHVIFRFRYNSVKTYILRDTLPKVLKLCFPGLPPLSTMLNLSDGFLRLPNGSEIWFGGLDDKERVEKILGGEYATIYFNECSQIPYQSVILALTRLAQKTGVIRLKAYYDFNPPSKQHWTYSQFVNKKDPITKKAFRRQLNYGFVYINPMHNKENLDPEYIEFLEDLPEASRNRFLHGRFSEDTEGQLWTEELLTQNRCLGQEKTLPNWLRIVVSVDPSGCSGPENTRSDEIGITVEALGTDGHGYLLEDLSGRYSPEGWAKVVESAFHRHGADMIIGEQNFGGDMVRAVIQARNSELPVELVHASRGKGRRAEPIAALYEQGKIHHVGYFPEVEEQMMGLTLHGYAGIKSPDRADSVIWGFTSLFPQLTRRVDDSDGWCPPGVRTAPRCASRYAKRGH